MVRILSILLLYGFIYAGSPEQDWLPNQYKKEAVQYYDALDSAQWADVYWHDENHGIRNAVYAGMEGSNRPRGKHGDEDSYQDVGINFYTARRFREALDLRDSLRVHAFAANLCAEIDSAKLAGHRKRNHKSNPKWRAKRPVLNATMAYPGGKSWRNRLIYGMVHEARCRELEKRLPRVAFLRGFND